MQIARGSTNEQQELLTLADPESSIGLARIVAAAPDSTHYGLVTRQVGYIAPSTTANVSSVAGVVAVAQNSTTWQVQAEQAGVWTVRANLSSTGGDNPVSAAQSGTWTVNVGAHLQSTAAQAANSSAINVRIVGGVSSAADNPVQAVQASTVWAVQLSNYSTTVQVSSVGGVVAVAQNSTVWVTQPRLHDGSGNALESSTSAASSGARGLIVRSAMPGLDSYSDSTTGQSSVTTILSSAAGSRGYVYAISVISTLGGPVAWGIYAGATRKWGGVLAAVSSAVSGAVIAVTPPAFLCKGSTGEPLTFNCESSNRGLNVSLGYWQST